MNSADALHKWLVAAMAALCCGSICSIAAAQSDELSAQLSRAEQIERTGGTAFADALQKLEAQQAAMSPHQRLQLRYLLAWEQEFKGDYAHAAVGLSEVMTHADSENLRVKAGAFLLGALMATRRENEAFGLANGLIDELPKVTDNVARAELLEHVSGLLRQAGQYDLAIDYARQAMDVKGPDTSVCRPATYLATVLYDDHRAQPDSPDVLKAVDACYAEKNPIYLDVLQVMQAEMFNDQRQPAKALEILHKYGPRMEADGYGGSLINLHTELAKVALQQGELATAQREARAAFALSEIGNDSIALMGAEKVMYESSERLGQREQALKYRELWDAQNAASQQAAQEKAAAYQVAKFDYDLHQMQLASLSQKQKMLILQRALDVKEAANYKLGALLIALIGAGCALFGLRLRRERARYREVAEHDGLTGAYTHQAFVRRAAQALRDCEFVQQEACLILLDLDHFKQVNDKHGHAMGDQVLLCTAELARAQLPKNAVFGRLGGEEFAAFLPGCGREQAIVLAEYIRGDFALAASRHDVDVVPFTASFGVASTERHGYAIAELVRQADLALYRAKHAGRNCVVSDFAPLRPSGA